jgi:hypothetical protein
MTVFLLGILGCLCLLILTDGLLRNRPFELPFFAAAVTSAFAIPQLIGLYRSPVNEVSEVGLGKTIFMTCLCIVMLRIGWTRGCASVNASAVHPSFYYARLIYWAGILAVIGCWGNWMLRSLPEEVLNQSQWSGLPVAYLFFANALTYAYALSLNIWLRCRAKTALVVIAIACVVYFAVIVFAGRRQPAAEFILIPASTIWLVKGKVAPRIFPVVAILVMVLFMHSTGDYRSAAGAAKKGATWEQARSIPYVGNLLTILQYGGPELTNAVMRVDAAGRSGRYDLGLSVWNAMVFNYVPRQIVGSEIKNALMFDLPDVEYETFGYTGATGTTWTGFANAFASFGYFGCLIFYFIAWVMGRIYSRACDDDLTAQVVYSLMLVQCGIVITHGYTAFFTPWPQIALFLLSGLYWVRKEYVPGLPGVGAPAALEMGA